ncbi:hypothetical protein BT69DRAFT_1316035 [Atractiella rhizophila]|nr:hypothetical protein BT69DRAFT_1316035 [Atractiella rhizophila]
MLSRSLVLFSLAISALAAPAFTSEQQDSSLVKRGGCPDCSPCIDRCDQLNSDYNKKSCAISCVPLCVCGPDNTNMNTTTTTMTKGTGSKAAFLSGYETCESRSTSFYDACTGQLKIG